MILRRFFIFLIDFFSIKKENNICSLFCKFLYRFLSKNVKFISECFRKLNIIMCHEIEL